ncbi:protein kinase [Achlya hypogyna]|uniref:Protein kinase n=1 Tax=Achlya hypogyna TaxID=1202772 RepID=A0A1V9YLK8_ACHHY|nr:protein kinase [Achlya hypogyna]
MASSAILRLSADTWVMSLPAATCHYNQSVLTTEHCAAGLTACVVDHSCRATISFNSSALADGSLNDVPIARVEHLPNILVLRGNGITSLGDLSADADGQPLQLQELTLVNQRLRGLGQSTTLPQKLRHLYAGPLKPHLIVHRSNLSGSPIESIHNLSFPTSLQSLDLSHARILDFTVSEASYLVLRRLPDFGANCTVRQPPACNGTLHAVLNYTLCVLPSTTTSMPPTPTILIPTTTLAPPSTSPTVKVSNASGSLASSTVTTIALTAAVVVVVLLLFIFLRRYKRDRWSYLDTVYKRQTTRLSVVSQHDVRFDPAIATLRLPRSDVHLLRRVGGDSGSVCYDGLWAPTATPVTVRQLRDGAAKATMDRFMTEIRLCTALHHTNIVACLGVFWSTSYDIAVVEEAMALGTLGGYMAVRAGDPSFAWTSVGGLATRLSIALDIAQALFYLHDDVGRLYEHLHTESVLVAATGTAKLVGFRPLATLHLAPIAPEVCSGGPARQASDVYALGVVLCEMDHGRRLEVEGEIGDDTMRDGLQDIATGFFKPAPTAKCPPEIADLIARCVAFDPTKRPDAVDVVAALIAFHEHCQRNTATLLLSTR